MRNARKYQIDFWTPIELPNKTLEFKILDENETIVGYAVASAIDSFAILGTNLNVASASDDFTSLKNDLHNFCEVYYHGCSDKTTES